MKIKSILWLLIYILSLVLSSCVSNLLKPEAALWGKWRFQSTTESVDGFAYDLEFVEDGTLKLNNNEEWNYIVISPQKIKLNHESESMVISYSVTDNSLLLIFSDGQNIYNFDNNELIPKSTEQNSYYQDLNTKVVENQQITETSSPKEVLNDIIDPNLCSTINVNQDTYCNPSWFMSGHDFSRTSWNKAESVLKPPLKIKFVQEFPDFYIDGVSVTDNMIFLSGMEAIGGKNQVFALDSSGNTLWKFKLQDGSGAMGSTPAYFPDNLLLFGGQHDDNLYALDSSTGKILWTKPGMNTLYASPVNLHDSKVYAFGEFLFSIDVHNGTELWSYKTSGWAGSTAIWDNILIASSWHTSPIAFDKDTGDVLWQRDDIHTYFSDVVAINNSVFLGDRTGKIFSLDIKNGDTLWITPLPFDLNFSDVTDFSLSFSNGFIYAAGGVRADEENPEPQNIIIKIDATTGKIIWQSKIISNWYRLVIANDFLYSFCRPDYDGQTILVAINTTTGKEVWSWQSLEKGSYSDIVVANNCLYLAYHYYDGEIPTSYLITFTNVD